MSKSKTHKILVPGLAGMLVGLALMAVLSSAYHRTSSNYACTLCHVHPHAETSWKQSPHYDNGSGTKTDCAACHLPPEGNPEHFLAKMAVGSKDLWSYIFKDKDKIDWESKRTLEYGQRITFNESCKECHVNLFPTGISDEGIIAHLHYQKNEAKDNLQCISCHLDAGHYLPGYVHESMGASPVGISSSVIYDSRAEVTSFSDYTETVPGTGAAIRMVAVKGGSFTMGSPVDEQLRRADEGPQKNVTVSSFFMAETEITWDQYWAFYNETMSEGHTPPEKIYANNTREDLDAVSGPTPPFGTPDQGWGMGDRPAITMTWYAAATFCQWLSLKTGRTYRLPTEAEWEYAARCGTSTPYFFGGKPAKFEGRGLWNSIFGADTTTISSYAVYALNSRSRTGSPSDVAANPWGLRNMNGNVMEYCSDWYSETAYQSLADGTTDPAGPATGTEHVVRGGCYASPAGELRSAARSHTEHDAWMKTDPQNPKSIWWYSDIKGIGFRVVCEVPGDIAL